MSIALASMGRDRFLLQWELAPVAWIFVDTCLSQLAMIDGFYNRPGLRVLSVMEPTNWSSIRRAMMMMCDDYIAWPTRWKRTMRWRISIAPTMSWSIKALLNSPKRWWQKTAWRQQWVGPSRCSWIDQNADDKWPLCTDSDSSVSCVTWALFRPGIMKPCFGVPAPITAMIGYLCCALVSTPFS